LSTICLTTYANVSPDTEEINYIPSITVPGKDMEKDLPAGRTFAMYGTKDSLAMLKRVRGDSRQKGLSTFRIDMHVNVEELILGKASLDNISKTRFLNLKRLKADIASLIFQTIEDDKFNDLIFNRSNAVDVCNIVGAAPYVLDKVWNLPELKHLCVIVWPAPIPGRKLLNGDMATEQVAAIRPDCISQIDIRNFDGIWNNAQIGTTPY